MLTASTWQILAGNLAVVALFVLFGSRVSYWLKPLPRPFGGFLFGGFMGMGAIASIGMAAQLEPGIYLDLRYSLLAVVALFGGWPAALVSCAIAASYRATMGGAAMFTGMLGIGLAGLAGLSINLLVGRSTYRTWHVGAVAVLSAFLTALASLTLPGATPQNLLAVLAPTVLLNMTTTIVAGLAYLQAWKMTSERELLAVALTNAPDMAYVKDRHGRFAAANLATAKLFGFEDAKRVIGKDNYAFQPAERARQQLEAEQQILQSGTPQLGLEEQVTEADGIVRWYATSKVPLHDRHGTIIGLAGVSRDITAKRQLEQDLVFSRDTLSHALAEMTGGLAMYDSAGTLLLCNEQYREAFPFTGALRQPGAHYRDILRAVLATREQPSTPQDQDAAAAWVESRFANLQRESEDEIHLANDRWLQIRTRPTSNGTTMVVAIDVTRFKQAEIDLHTTTTQLKHLVRTDSLTGLLNRRAFDDAIEGEIRRTGRAGTALSLLLVDVDRFKPYNDHYGHLAGDEALRQVSNLLKASLKRPGDVVARFGGEEFTAILPDTDEDGAYLVAESFRRALAEARLPHAGADKGYITASVGVATYMPDAIERSAVDLIETADGALYSAKAAGRDRVFGTRVAAKGHFRAQS
ncbi:diguanylate cyclase [Devosia beringensis]|uniref:diguanylate cyclase n=1 Tax=Devosia beringensis TaxID=2657486 RepID=UPI00186B73E5|nr:diguanylate cyclase [Devosia beringensis]